jgi:hypothetical protein
MAIPKSNFVEHIRERKPDYTDQQIVDAFMMMYENRFRGEFRSATYVNGVDAEFGEGDLRFIDVNFSLFAESPGHITKLLYAWKTSKTGGVSIGFGGTYIGFWALVDNYNKNNVKPSTSFVNVFAKLLTSSKETSISVKQGEDLIKFLRDNESQIYKLYSLQEYTFGKFDSQVIQTANMFFRGVSAIPHIKTPLYTMQSSVNMLSLGDVAIRQEFKDLPEDNPLIPGGFFQEETIFRAPIAINTSTGVAKPPPFVPTLSSDYFSSLKIAATAVDTATSIWTIDDTTKINKILELFYISFFMEFLKLTNFSGDKFIYNSQALDKVWESAKIAFIDKGKIQYEANGTVWNGTLGNYLAKKMIDAYRLKVWKNIANYIKDNNLDPKSVEGSDLDGLAKEAFQGAEEAAGNIDDIQVDPEAKKDQDLTEAQIKEKQKFLKQCILMTQLEKLRKEHLESINNPLTNVHFKGGSFLPYRGRFFMVKESTNDQSSTINKLLIPSEQSISQFLNISPSVAAHLVPKLRFFKVFTTDDGRLDEFEFQFRNFTDSSRVNNLSNTNFDRGGDFGVKSFDFSFDGTSPATAKNDIKADLKLYFQSFGDFIQKRKFGDQQHSFVDLLLLPGGQPKSGSGKESSFQYEPSYYRIRVDVGWMINPLEMPSVKQNIGVKGAQDLVKALELINKSFYLNMIDHTMDFRDDGSVDISVNYRAYVESALKGTGLDALADKRTQKSLEAARLDYEKIVEKQICNASELNSIRRSLSQLQDLLRKQSLQSIMKRLVERLMIRTKKADKNQADVFAKTGFLDKKVNLEEADSSNVSDDYLHINYFYLADLLYVILDSIYDETGENYIQGAENFKFILTSFEYPDVFSNSGNPPPINIGSIPITTDIFIEWFKENVLKPERSNYPIMYFIRDLCKFLLVEIMSETCFKSTFDRSLNFKTANFLGKRDASGRDPMASMYPLFNPAANDAEDLVIDVTSNYDKGKLPVTAEGGTVSNLQNYIIVYAETPILTAEGKVGDPHEDGKRGIIHYRIGQDKGIVKKIKFSKSDMQYIREARFMRHGNDGLMQLSAVYKVSLDMIGNTLYYPGMEVFIDPVGFLGANEDADPRIINSVANKLGFGGYHLVTSVKSSIAPGKFTTTIDALFHYSGDQQPSSIIIGKGKDAKKVSEIKKVDEKPANSGMTSPNCIEVNNKIVSQLGNIAYKGKSEYESLDLRTEQEKQEALVQGISQLATAAGEQKDALQDLAAEKLKGAQEALKQQGEDLLEQGAALFKKTFGGK